MEKEHELKHFGVKGMEWGKKKEKDEKVVTLSGKEVDRLLEIAKDVTTNPETKAILVSAFSTALNSAKRPTSSRSAQIRREKATSKRLQLIR